MHDATRDTVEYMLGYRIAGLTQDADGVNVTFAAGGRRRFDLVIGADGLHSALPSIVFGPRERCVRHPDYTYGQALAGTWEQPAPHLHSPGSSARSAAQAPIGVPVPQ